MAGFNSERWPPSRRRGEVRKHHSEIGVPGQGQSFLRLRATAWWSWSDSNQPPKCYGTWFESDQLPWSDAYPVRRRFAVLLDFPAFLILEPTRVLWNMVRVDQLPWSDTHPDRRRLLFSVTNLA